MSKVEVKETLSSYLKYAHILAVFGDDIEAVEEHILSVLSEEDEHEAYQSFYDTIDSRSVSTDSLIDALMNAFDKIKEK